MKLAILAALGAIALAAADKGLPARANPADYPSHASADDVTIAAYVLPDDEVQSGFATDLYRRYAVVEIAVYPAAGKSLEISDVDFGLKYDAKPMPTRAASPRTVAGALQRRAANQKSGIGVIPSVGVGVGNDPYGGGMGTGTSVGVGVGVGSPGGPPAPASTPADRQVMQTELEDRALPSGTVSKPVAGYLYFPLPLKKNVLAQEITFERDGRTVRVPLRPATAKTAKVTK